MLLKYTTLEDALQDNPGLLIIELDCNLFGGLKLMRLKKPGATARSKPIDILGFVVVGESHPDLLRSLADAIERGQANVPTPQGETDGAAE
jgi:hypothetical protein